MRPVSGSSDRIRPSTAWAGVPRRAASSSRSTEKVKYRLLADAVSYCVSRQYAAPGANARCRAIRVPLLTASACMRTASWA